MTDPDDIEWLDDDGATGPRHDEELTAGSSRPPLRRRTRIVLGVLTAAVLGGAVTIGVTAGDERPQAATTPSATSSTPATPAPSLPARPSGSTLAALRSAFPGAVLTGYVAVRALGPVGEVFRIYNMSSGQRMINVTLRPAHDNDHDGVYRSYSSVEIAQSLGSIFVQATVRVTTGQPSARDFAAIQQIVQDARLLAAR